MKLHVLPPSPNSRKAIFANAHVNAGATLHPIDFQSGAHKTPDFLGKNPNGKLPVLEFDDGATLWESNAIVNRLASETENDLWPRTMARYDIMQWQFWEASHLQPACEPFISKHFFGRDGVDIDAATEVFTGLAGILDDHLAGRSWLVADTMTTADICVSAYLAYRTPCQYPLEGRANIDAWLARVEAAPAWAVANPPPA